MIKKNNIHNKNLPMILIILDGWGIAEPNKGNAISLAKIPTMDGLIRKYANTKLHAHGKYVGLPRQQVGNSEAGHLNMGGGRLVEQDVVIISKSINDGTFYKNSAFLGAIRHIRKMNSKLHLIGMLSNGQSPHSDPGHLVALMELLKRHNIENICLHLFTDGRDSPRYASLKLVDDLEKLLTHDERIATIMGRFYAMDRKKKWERTEKAYNALVLGRGRKAKSAQAAITEAYNKGNNDEFIEPYVITDNGGTSTRIEEGDSVIFFNLRSDRGRQLTKAFAQSDFNKMNRGAFRRKKQLHHLYFVAMTDFGPDLDDILTAYPSVDLRNTLPMHDQTPAMSSEKLTKMVITNLKKGKRKNYKYDFVVLNFAAPDMVGHTGNIEAGIKCCRLVDKFVSKIVKAYLAVGGTVLITADHGNIEEMINLETGEIFTEHTTNPVPFIVINKKLKNKIKLRANGILGDIAPTILKLLGCKKPKEMKGKSLIK
jgi:2,3-bisphosphoglycerate-independent phosphoglycerate mutase